jgi:putative DNA primase/helicase
MWRTSKGKGAAVDSPNRTANGSDVTDVLRLALAYQDAGLSVLPISRDGSKAPDWARLPRVPGEDGKYHATWDPFKEEPMREEDVRRRFGGLRPPGIGIIGGMVSGGLLVLDFEFLDFFEEWLALVEAQAPGLATCLPTIRTPGKEEAGGRHVYVRSSGPAVASGKLARITRAEAERRTGDPGKTTAVEVKAEGGYVLAVGCPAECHETGRLYEHLSGPPIEATRTVSESEVNLLLACARALERGDKAAADRRTEPAGEDTNRPGDEFNRRADWLDDVLLPAGWKKVRQRDEVIYLCRPGKSAGVSATIGYCRSERAGPKLYVFSSNAEPFEEGKSYSKFEAFTLLNHGGNYEAAARDLARKGYGDPRPKESRNGTAGVRAHGKRARDTADEDVHLTDAGNAKRLVARHGENLRHCGPWRKWLTWDGRRWDVDQTGGTMRLAKDTVATLFRGAADEVNDIARKLEEVADA